MSSASSAVRRALDNGIIAIAAKMIHDARGPREHPEVFERRCQRVGVVREGDHAPAVDELKDDLHARFGKHRFAHALVAPFRRDIEVDHARDDVELARLDVEGRRQVDSLVGQSLQTLRDGVAMEAQPLRDGLDRDTVGAEALRVADEHLAEDAKVREVDLHLRRRSRAVPHRRPKAPRALVVFAHPSPAQPIRVVRAFAVLGETMQ